MNRPVLAIHGGCGVMDESQMSAEEWREARMDLARSLKAGWQVLARGGAALDALEAAVVVMEDSPHFNAGHGSALNRAGDCELDAAIMDGSNLAAGGVAAARRIRNPIRAARAVLDAGDAVLLAGDGADAFAGRAGLEMVMPDYFRTERRGRSLAAVKAYEAGERDVLSEAEKHGTVGAVALDGAGRLAAATSTGGFTNKPVGRVGDSPIIGAGTYARNGLCAVSGTGKGEYFMRHLVAYTVANRMACLGETLAQAAETVIKEDLTPLGAGAGLIAVGADGTIAAPFNTGGMFRGWTDADGRFHVASHAELFTVDPAELG